MKDTNIMPSGSLVGGRCCPWKTPTSCRAGALSGAGVAHEGHQHHAEREPFRGQVLPMKDTNIMSSGSVEREPFRGQRFITNPRRKRCFITKTLNNQFSPCWPVKR